MKKILAIILAMLLGGAGLLVHAEEPLDPAWELVPKPDLGSAKFISQIGNFVFKVDKTPGTNSLSLWYSSDGGATYLDVNLESCGYPIYRNGLYFIIDTSLDPMPENKKYNGFQNNPAYILDENLNVLYKFDKPEFLRYIGYYEGYHYLWSEDYSNFRYEGTWVGEKKEHYYRTSDGTYMEEIKRDETVEMLLNGDFMYDNSIIYTPSDSDHQIKYLIEAENQNIIQREREDFRRISWMHPQIPVYKMAFQVGLEEKFYLTMDGIYGIAMPDDAGAFCYDLNDGYLYFRVYYTDNMCYRIPKSLLMGHTKVVYDGKVLAFETPPVTEDDRTLVPMRFLFEQMGADVTWEPETRSARVSRAAESIRFSIDNTVAEVNGAEKVMDVPARLVGDKTMIPVRFLSEELGYTVEWDEENRIVTIS